MGVDVGVDVRVDVGGAVGVIVGGAVGVRVGVGVSVTVGGGVAVGAGLGAPHPTTVPSTATTMSRNTDLRHAQERVNGPVTA